VSNASFESPSTTSGTGGPVPDDWSLFGEFTEGDAGPAGVVSETNSNIPGAVDGSQWLLLAEGTGSETGSNARGGVVSDPIGTATPGLTYEIGFTLGKDDDNPLWSNPNTAFFLQTSNDGFSSIETTDFSALFDIPTFMGAQTVKTSTTTITLKSSAGSDLRMGFRLEQDGSPGEAVLLDNLSVAAIPEPAHGAVVAGLLAGVALLRRRNIGA